MNAVLRHSKSARAAISPQFDEDAVASPARVLTDLLPDLFALYVKTKNLHWHISGPHFRYYHLRVAEQADQILTTTDDIAARAVKIGGMTLHSIGQIAKPRRIAEFVCARAVLIELCDDHAQLAARLRDAQAVCDEHGDVVSAALIENWIDQAESRFLFLRDVTRLDPAK
jgi:starvation-inducible DNA-binding protein